MGVYHYAQPGSAPGGAAVQADHFVDVSGWTSGDLLPVLDIERTNGLSSSALQVWVAEFLDRIYVRTGVHAAIYTSPSFWRTNLADNSMIAQNGYSVLWVAHWDNRFFAINARLELGRVWLDGLAIHGQGQRAWDHRARGPRPPQRHGLHTAPDPVSA